MRLAVCSPRRRGGHAGGTAVHDRDPRPKYERGPPEGRASDSRIRAPHRKRRLDLGSFAIRIPPQSSSLATPLHRLFTAVRFLLSGETEKRMLMERFVILNVLSLPEKLNPTSRRLMPDHLPTPSKTEIALPANGYRSDRLSLRSSHMLVFKSRTSSNASISARHFTRESKSGRG